MTYIYEPEIPIGRVRYTSPICRDKMVKSKRNLCLPELFVNQPLALFDFLNLLTATRLSA